MFLRASAVFLIVLCATAAQAGVYKWTDAQGKVHYGDVPPPEQKTDKLNVQPATEPSDDVEDESESRPEPKPAAKKPRDARADAAREAERTEANRRQMCEEIRREQKRIDAAPSGKAITGEQRELRGKMVEQNAAAARHYRCE